MSTLKLSSFKAKQDATAVTIRNPETGEELLDDDGNPLAQIHVFGKASKKYRDMTDARLKEAIIQGKLQGKTKAPDLTVDKVRKEGIEWAVSLTSHISGMETDDGKALNTPEAIREVFSNPEYYWLLEQANAAIENDSNFFKP